jgi:hypothetical protein
MILTAYSFASSIRSSYSGDSINPLYQMLTAKSKAGFLSRVNFVGYALNINIFIV